MSLEAALAENTQTMVSLTEMLKVTAANQERLIAGQQAALEKVEAPARTRTTRTKKEEGNGAAEQTKTDAPKDEAPTATSTASTTNSSVRAVSVDELKAIGLRYLSSMKDAQGADGVKEAKEFIDAVANELGTPKINGPESNLDATGRLKAAFYIQRKQAGLSVDFGADYDFDGDPTAGADGDTGGEIDEEF